MAPSSLLTKTHSYTPFPTLRTVRISAAVVVATFLLSVAAGVIHFPAQASGPPLSGPDRDQSGDFDTLSAIGDAEPIGIWSDGTTMWVATFDQDSSNSKIYAYDMTSKARVPSRDFDTLSAAGNIFPTGIWSDGTTMWVANAAFDEDMAGGKIYAYDMDNKARVPGRDFDTLSTAENIFPTGIWSDETTMWVANAAFDEDLAGGKIYAYDVDSKTRIPSRDFDTLTAAGNIFPRGIWSDGATMWVADSPNDDRPGDYNKVYAYDMDNKARVPTRDLSDDEFNFPTGIWSDGATMWVLDGRDNKIYAYNLPQDEPTSPDRNALVALYNATDGPNWANNANWLSDRPISEWYGVSKIDDYGVIGLDLRENQLSGEIPAELGSLSELESLWLYDNQLTGEIPPEIGNLSNLEVLFLSRNQLTGKILPEIGNLSNLGGLSLYDNQLTGEIPPEIGNLSNLQSLAGCGRTGIRAV